MDSIWPSSSQKRNQPKSPNCASCSDLLFGKRPASDALRIGRQPAVLEGPGGTAIPPANPLLRRLNSNPDLERGSQAEGGPHNGVRLLWRKGGAQVEKVPENGRVRRIRERPGEQRGDRALVGRIQAR